MIVHFPAIPERVRAYVYRVAAAVITVLAIADDGIDLTDGADVAALVGLIGALLATANTSTKPDA